MRSHRQAGRAAWQVRAALAVAAGVFLSAAGAQTSYRRLRDIRFWSLSEATRIAIETTGAVQYRSERVESPARVFFDLLDTLPQAAGRGLRTIPVNDKLVHQIRIAETQPGVVRVVLDLAAPAGFSVSQLTRPSRLMIEVRPAAPEPEARAFVPPPDGPRKITRTELADPPELVAENRFDIPAAEKQAAPVPQRKASSRKAVPAKPASGGQPSLIRALGLKLDRVVLDPGHGGHDTGTIGPGGLREKDLVMDVARRLAGLLSQRLSSEVVLTRSDDTFVPLETRTGIAMQDKADLFVSIHANASRAVSTAGAEVYYLNFTTDRHALDVASRENAASSHSINDYPQLLEKIALNEKIRESRELAGKIQNSLYTNLYRSRKLRNRGVKKAPFVVLIGAQIPSVLAEIDFLSNPREEIQLKKPEYRQRIAEALFRGIAQYAGGLSRFQLAQERKSEVGSR